MKNIDLIFNKNNITSSNNIIFQKHRIIYTIKSKVIGGKEIKDIVMALNYIINKYGQVKIPIVLNLEDITFADKLTYILLDCICYYILTVNKRKIYINLALSNSIHIQTEGILSSPLLLISSTKKNHFEEYKKKLD